LGAFDSAAVGVVPAALAQFRRTHPGVQVQLSQLEPDMSDARILRGELDIALTFDYDRAPRPVPPRIRRTLAVKDPVLAVLPAGHPLARRREVNLAGLAGSDWIGTPVTALQPGLLAEISLSPGFRPRLQYDGDDFRTVLGLVDQGLGIALLPRLATLRAPSGVVAKPIAENPLSRFIYISRLETRHAPAALTAFEHHLAQTLRALPGKTARTTRKRD
jgi:DNA-binding transcriptional LysR family regulator